MKAHAISRGLVHFRSESQSIIVIELLKYKESWAGGLAALGGFRQELFLPRVREAPGLRNEHGKYAN